MFEGNAGNQTFGTEHESPEILARRCIRWDRARAVVEERSLLDDLQGFRIGAYRYLNARPLIYGIESLVKYGTPRELAVMMAQGELDAALLSIVDVIKADRYDVLDGVGIASLGEVKSVVLFHSEPIEQVKVIYIDPASSGSFYLLRVILKEWGLTPEIKTLSEWPPKLKPQNLLLIGDRALDMQFQEHDYHILDVGAAWYEMTGLPFVHAVWAIRRDINSERLRQGLRKAWKLGLANLDEIIRSEKRYTYEFRQDYLGWHLHFHVGSEEKRGISTFAKLLEIHGMGPVFDPKFV